MNQEWLESLVGVRPSKRQLEWQKLEFTAFFHYGINSFTGKEWGDGTEDRMLFQPKALDTDQWCRCLKDAEAKACIITAKHHDGFCLWDTKFTERSVMHTAFRRDVVAELANSCKKYGLKLGIYVSPWDRHEATYGSGKAYDDFFCGQLTELLTNYGELYAVWFDGACGEGANGKKQQYDWDRYYALIRKYQPNAVISISGPDVRWCGNEAGDCRESEWSVVPKRLFSQKAIAESSQQADEETFRGKKLDERNRDLGSRAVIQGEREFIWYPAEVDTSIRPGWFYHEEEDDRVRSLAELTELYEKSVGGNSVLLLNIPPHRDGYLAKQDVERLHELGEYIRTYFQTFRTDVKLTASSERQGYEAKNLQKDDEQSWMPEQGEKQAELVLTLEEKQPLNYLILKEQISEGQRVERFHVEFETDGGYLTVAKGTTIGYQKVIPLRGRIGNRLRIVLEEARIAPVLNCVRVS